MKCIVCGRKLKFNGLHHISRVPNLNKPGPTHNLIHTNCKSVYLVTKRLAEAAL